MPNNSTQQKLNLLRKYFPLYGVEYSELVLYLKDESGESATLDDNSRFGLRKRYWNYVLPRLQNEFGAEGLFSTIHPSTSSWINGYTGVGGVHLTCVANLDNARVEFCLESSNAGANKAIFDKLSLKRALIEERAEISFQWDRGDDRKSSKITRVFDNNGIQEEEAWPEIAAFHVSECRRMFDAFWPEIGVSEG